MSIQDFLVPDGSYYIAINEDNSSSTLESALQDFAPAILETSKTRMVWDNKQFNTAITNFADTLLPIASHKPYATNFFEVPRNSLTELINHNEILNLNKYPQKFSVKETTSQDFETIKDFMFSSFGVKFKVIDEKTVSFADESKRKRILENLEKSLSSPILKAYLILDETNTPCGFFSLANLGQDLQLHSVAGLSSFPPIPGLKKLQLIMAAVLHTFDNHANYKDCIKLTFSNSKEKVSQMYKDLGFKLSQTRNGIITELCT